MKEKILITGGAGYKGVHLVTRLLNMGYSVSILDNFMYGYEPILHIVNHPNIEILSMDIRNINESILKHFDVIYHLAGISGMPACAANPNSAENINIDATRKLVSFMHKSQLLINASTTSFYGSSGIVFDELAIPQPVSIYGMTKYEAEKIVMQRENTISLRFATVFGVGPRMRNDLMVNDFTYKAIYEHSVVLFSGYSKRSFIHIDDAVGAYVFALLHADEMVNNIFNIGNEAMNYSKQDVANAIKKYIDFEIIDTSIQDLDVRNFLVSFEKINKLGYKTKKNLDDGIKELIKLYSFYKVHSHFNII